MALTDLELVRLRANDPERTFQEEFAGDGSTTVFDLSHFQVVAASEQIRVAGTLQTDPANYSLADATGRITFVSAPANGARIVVQGRNVVWSDTELNDIIARRGSARDAVLECLQILMVDAARRIKWSTNQGLGVDESMMARNVQMAYELVKAEQENEAFGSGGLESAAVNQEDYV